MNLKPQTMMGLMGVRSRGDSESQIDKIGSNSSLVLLVKILIRNFSRSQSSSQVKNKTRLEYLARLEYLDRLQSPILPYASLKEPMTYFQDVFSHK